MVEVFFDTNILLYLLSADVEKASRAEELLEGGGTISVNVLNEFAAVATRKFGMRIREIREVLATIRGLCKVRPVDLEAHERALNVAERYRCSIYDSLVVADAIGARCTILWTEDLHHGQKIEQLTIRNPFLR